MPFADQLKSLAQEKEENRKYQAACDAIRQIKDNALRDKQKAALKEMKLFARNHEREKVQAAMLPDNGNSLASRNRFSDTERKDFMECVSKYMLMYDVSAHVAVPIIAAEMKGKFTSVDPSMYSSIKDSPLRASTYLLATKLPSPRRPLMEVLRHSLPLRRRRLFQLLLSLLSCRPLLLQTLL